MGCGAEAQPTPHSPPSREGSGGGGWGREHSGVIYSYIHILGNLFISFLIYSKERRITVFPKTASLSLVVLKRAPHYHVLENGVFLNFSTQKSAAGLCSRQWVFLRSVYSRYAAWRILEIGVFLMCVLKKAPHCPSLEIRAGFGYAYISRFVWMS